MQKTIIDRTITVWSVNGPKPGAGNSRPVIIASHGGQSSGYKLWDAPAGVSINFYCPDGSMYSGMLANIADRSYEIFETVGGGQKCRDYDLTHDQATTSELIEGLFQSKAELAASMKQAGWKPSQIDDYLKNRSDMGMDLVTVVPKPRMKDVRLSKVVELLRKNGWLHSEVHCAHCRYAANSAANGKVVLPSGTSTGSPQGLSFTPRKK